MARLVGGVGWPEPEPDPATGRRVPGAQRRAVLRIDRGLKTRRLDVVELDEADLLSLIVDAGSCLQRMRAQRQQGGS